MDSNQIWAMTQSANARGQQPLADFSSLMSQKSLADLARRQHLQDVGSERAYEQSSADAASNRRIKEYTEDERLRAVKEMADQGVPVHSNMSMDDLASAKRDFMTQRATTQLGVIQAQMESARSKQQQAIDAIHRIASSPAVGTKEQRLQALRVALTDPAAARLPDDTRAQLMTTLANGEDPAKQVDKAIQEMSTKYYGNKGTFSGMSVSDRLKNAQGFQQAYLTALQPAANESQKADLIAAMKGLDDSNKQVEALNQQAFAHFGANAGFLPKDVMTQWSAKNGPPPDPNAVMQAATANQTPKKSPQSVASPVAASSDVRPQRYVELPPAAQTGTTPAPAFTPPSRPAARFDWETGPTGPSLAQVALGEGPPIGVPSISDIGTAYGPSAYERTDLPPGQDEINAFRAATLAATPKPGAPQQLMAASPQEELKAQALVAFGLKAKGMSDSDVQQFIANAKAKAMAGDQSAISGHNAVLKIVRMSGQAPPAPVTAGQSPLPTPNDTAGLSQ